MRKRRAARGLLYEDLEDTQPSQLPRKRPSRPDDDDLSSDGSGFDIGAKVSPAKGKVMTPKKRGRRGGTLCSGRTQTRSVVSPAPFDRADEAAASSKRTVLRKEPNATTEVLDGDPGPDATEDVDGLLKEMGKKRTNAELCPEEQEQSAAAKPAPFRGQKKRGGAGLAKEADTGSSAGGKAKLSVLDDIFSEPEDCQRKKRKPPPSRGQQKWRTTETPAGSKQTGSAAESSAIPSTSGPRIVGRPSAPASSDVFSDLMNDSTLLDDGVDCFGEPSQWKKRVKKRKAPTRKIDRLLQETTDDYLQLFESGRLVKKRQREKDAGQKGDSEGRRAEKEEELTRREVKRLESSEVDLSGSLFS